MDNSFVESPQASPAGGRLDSWKEIASYLRKSVRSVQRWEAEEGMPVHRHVHAKSGTVYAFPSELDAWWKERGAILAEQNGAVEEVPTVADPVPAEAAGELGPSPRRSRTPAWIATGFLTALLAAGAGAWLARNGSRPAGSLSPLAFKARDWVLVADFENRTGEQLFDGTLDYALVRELSNSRHVNVVPRERIGDSLRLMRKPRDSPISDALGREICLRDGEIGALLTGRVERLQSTYVLSVEIVEPRQGTTLAGFSEEATGADATLAAVRRISDRIRVALRENPSPGVNDKRLVKVTTPNLRALQLYSQADSMLAGYGNPAAAEELLRQAVAEDPSFASAWILLAWTLENQGRPLAEFQHYVETALRLAETTADRERYFIRGSYYALSGQQEQAIAAYEALVSLYPDHFWATNNLAIIYRELGRDREAVRFAVRRSELRPKDLDRRVGATRYLARLEPDRDRASIYARQTLERVSPEFLQDSPNAAAWLELFPANERWLEGDVAGALALATRFAEKLDSTPSLRQDPPLVQLGNLFLSLGRLETAEGIFRRLSDPAYELAGLALLRGNRRELKRLSRAAVAESYDVHLGAGILLARTGLVDQGERVLVEWERDPSEALPGMLEAARGELAMARGRPAEALRQLWESQEKTRDLGSFAFLLGSETLASALARQGDLDGAIRVLELGPRQKRQAAFHGANNGAIWMRNQLLLARLQRRAGRDAEARRIEADLLTMLSVADADHPILLELERLQK